MQDHFQVFSLPVPQQLYYRGHNKNRPPVQVSPFTIRPQVTIKRASRRPAQAMSRILSFQEDLQGIRQECQRGQKAKLSGGLAFTPRGFMLIVNIAADKSRGNPVQWMGIRVTVAQKNADIMRRNCKYELGMLRREPMNTSAISVILFGLEDTEYCAYGILRMCIE